MNKFAYWLETNPVYKSERKRASRGLRRYEATAVTAGLLYAIVMAAFVASGLWLNFRAALVAPAINAVAQGWVLAIAFCIILNSADERSGHVMEQMQLAGVSSGMLVWGKLFGFLLPSPRSVRKIPGSFATILAFWGLVSLAFGQPLARTLINLALALMIPLGGLFLGIEGGGDRRGL